MRKWLILALLAILTFSSQASAGWYWLADQNITNSPSTTEATPGKPGHAIAVPTGSYYPVHAIYYKLDAYLGRYLCYKKKTALTTWTVETVLVNPPNLAKEGHFSIATDPTGNYVYVVYRNGNGQIDLIRSTDAGTTWEDPVRISPNTSSYYYLPDIAAANNGKVFMVWQQQSIAIGFASSEDYGVSWSVTEQIDVSGAVIKYDPSIATDINGTYVYVAWGDWFSTEKTIVSRTYTTSTSSWSGMTTLALRPITYDYIYGSVQIDCAKDGSGKVHVVWDDNYNDMLSPTFDVYYVRSTDNGTTWSPNIIISGNSDNSDCSRLPAISASPSNANTLDLIYSEYDTTDNIDQLYWRRTTDGGITWGTITPLTTVGDNFNACLATGYSNWIQVVFVSLRDNNYELYHKCYYYSKTRPPAPKDSPTRVTFDDETLAVGGIRVMPNPVVNEARISFGLSGNGNLPAIVKVYDIQGRFVRNLSVKKIDSGQASATWDCKDAAGRRVSSGVYLVSVQNNEQRETCRIILSK